MLCPKCGYERRPDDDRFVSNLECPKCGIVYAKYQEELPEQESDDEPADLDVFEAEVVEMNECERCGFKIPKPYKLCYDCAGAIDSERRQPAAVSPEKETQKPTQKSVGFVLAVIIACVWVFLTSLGGESKTKEVKDWKKDDASIMAFIMMEDFVKGQLKAPASADFPGFSEGRDRHVQRLDGQKYRIISWVDAQNSFGAKIRNHFIGEIEQTSKDYWKLNSLEFATN